MPVGVFAEKQNRDSSDEGDSDFRLGIGTCDVIA
jgi:hypothetical protein